MWLSLRFVKRTSKTSWFAWLSKFWLWPLFLLVLTFLSVSSPSSMIMQAGLLSSSSDFDQMKCGVANRFPQLSLSLRRPRRSVPVSGSNPNIELVATPKVKDRTQNITKRVTQVGWQETCGRCWQVYRTVQKGQGATEYQGFGLFCSNPKTCLKLASLILWWSYKANVAKM